MSNNTESNWKCEGYTEEPHPSIEVEWDQKCPICNRERNSPKHKGGKFPIGAVIAALSAVAVLGGGYWLWPNLVSQNSTDSSQESTEQTITPTPSPNDQTGEKLGSTVSSASPSEKADSSQESTEQTITPKPSPNDQTGEKVDSTVPSTPPSEKATTQKQLEGFSQGEQTLFSGTGNVNRDRGIEAFQKGDYSKAAELFKKATEADRNDPEVLIYYNNALANQKPNPITLAVVVPIDSRLTSAQEMLRGVAQAQNKFNNSGGFNDQLLQIAIANDGNKPELSEKVARELVNDSSIIGVIGHNSSSASQAGLAVYEEAGLPMISPTSTSTSLSGKAFFRTVPSDAAAGEKLANYAYNKLLIDNAVIFYNPKSSYSSSLKEAFEKNFDSLGGQVIRSVDLSDPEFDAKIDITRIALKKEAQAALLFPNTQFTSVALEITKANSQLETEERLKLLGGDALYSPTTLKAGASVEDLILAVPWFAKSPLSQDFSKMAEKQWGGLVNWRTAMSFDATQAFINAFSSNISRSEVLQQLQGINLSSDKTSGSPLEFTSEGERRSEPILVKATQGGSVAPNNSKFGFDIVRE
ncbi:MAG: ABC transporter substrate-binding protein [Okeania sp. SIO3B5]|nr:ABC transporter substrate-binding protein [Okeania sp. SIO3B5]